MYSIMLASVIILDLYHTAGIYLMYNELLIFCLPGNAQISRMLVKCTNNNAALLTALKWEVVESVWTGPEGAAINSSLSQSGINLQLSSTSNVGNYTCTHSGSISLC